MDNGTSFACKGECRVIQIEETLFWPRKGQGHTRGGAKTTRIWACARGTILDLVVKYSIGT